MEFGTRFEEEDVNYDYISDDELFAIFRGFFLEEIYDSYPYDDFIDRIRKIFLKYYKEEEEEKKEEEEEEEEKEEEN